MVQSLRWESLRHRRDRLPMLFHVQHGLVDVNTDYIQLNDTRSRGSQRLRQLNANTDVYKYAFYPRTICDWNQLPTTVTEVQTLQEFREGLSCLPSRLLRPYLATQQHVHSFNLARDLGHFFCLSGIAVLHKVTYNLRLLPLQC